MIVYYILITSLPYMRHPFWEHSLGGGLSVIKLVGGINVLYALAYLARRHCTPRYFATPQSKWMVLFFAMASFSFLTNDHVDLGFISPIAMYASVALLFFVTLSVVDSMRRLYWSLMVTVGSLAFASLYLLREYMKGSAVYGDQYRPGYVVGDANYFAVAALACMPIAFELLWLSRNRWVKLYCLACLSLTFIAITLGASRGGFLGIIVQLTYLIFRSRRPLRNAVLVSLIALPFIFLAPNSPVRRILHPKPGDTNSVDEHILGWEAGLNMVKAHPFTGVGLGNYKSVVVQYDTTGLVAAHPHIAHNAYLEVAAEMGIPAFVVYLIFFATAFRSLERTRKRSLAAGADELAALTIGMQSSLLGAWVAIFFVSGQYTKLFWFLLVLTMCLPRLIRRSNVPISEVSTPEEATEEMALQVAQHRSTRVKT